MDGWGSWLNPDSLICPFSLSELEHSRVNWHFGKDKSRRTALGQIAILGGNSIWGISQGISARSGFDDLRRVGPRSIIRAILCELLEDKTASDAGAEISMCLDEIIAFREVGWMTSYMAGSWVGELNMVSLGKLGIMLRKFFARSAKFFFEGFYLIPREEKCFLMRKQASS